MSKAFKWPILIIASAGFISLIILLLLRITPVPPEDEMLYARQSLSEASRDRADTYSKKLYMQVQKQHMIQRWPAGEVKIRDLFFSGTTKRLKSTLNYVANRANQATESSQTNSSSLRVRLKDKIDDLNNTAECINKLFGRTRCRLI